MRAIPGTVTEYGIENRLQKERRAHDQIDQAALNRPDSTETDAYVVGYNPTVPTGVPVKVAATGDHTRVWHNQEHAQRWATTHTRETTPYRVYKLVAVSDPAPERKRWIDCQSHGFQQMIKSPGLANDWTCVQCV